MSGKLIANSGVELIFASGSFLESNRYPLGPHDAELILNTVGINPLLQQLRNVTRPSRRTELILLTSNFFYVSLVNCTDH